MIKKIMSVITMVLMAGVVLISHSETVNATPVETQAAIKTAQTDLSKLNNNISNLTVTAEQLKNQMTAKQTQITATQGTLDQTNAAYTAQVKLIEGNLQQLQAKDSSFNLAMLDSLLDSRNLGDLFQKGAIMDRLMDAKVSNATETEDLAKQVTKQKQTLESQQTKLNELAKTNTETLTSLNQQKTTANTQLKQLQAKYKTELAAQAAAAEAANKVGLKAATGNPAISNNAIVKTTLKYIGVPYVWGGTSPKGFDCSGLVQYVFAQNGQQLPRTSQEQSKLGKDVALKDLQPTDLLFWGGVGTAHHVAIYIGNGYFIQAPQPGDHVRVTKLTDYVPDFARRL